MQQITKYIASDGSEFTDELSCRYYEMKKQHGEAYQCPKCLGRGKVFGKPIIQRVRDYDAEGYQGFFSSPCYKDEVVGYGKLDCDVCYGSGYTKELKKPVTKTTVVGYA